MIPINNLDLREIKYPPSMNIGSSRLSLSKNEELQKKILKLNLEYFVQLVAEAKRETDFYRTREKISELETNLELFLKYFERELL